MNTESKNISVGLIASNLLRIHENVKKGTEIFVYLFSKALSEQIDKQSLSLAVTCFASGNSDLPFPIESIQMKATSEDTLLEPSTHKPLELALFSKAFGEAQNFDLFHIHVSNGEWILPFAAITKTPVLITMHGGVNDVYDPTLFSPYANLKNIHYVSISDSQRKRIPQLPYIKTIHHGIDVEKLFTFSASGGESLIWAGRGIPHKGLHQVVEVFERIRKPMQLFPIVVNQHAAYLAHHLTDRIDFLSTMGDIKMELNLNRRELIKHYQESKAFIFPLQWEEPFGLVMVESLACGTPVIAYAKGSASEIIIDGVTGYLVNPSDHDVRGSFITKASGLDGLVEATNHIYNLSHEEYRAMRQASRDHAAKNFSTERMVSDYLSLYQQVAKNN